MKLYMKQKVFSWADKFTIKDEHGNDKYYVEGELFSWGHKLHVMDFYGSEVAFIKQKLMTFLPKFEVYINDVLKVKIIKEFTFFTPKYTIEGMNWKVLGDFWSHDYIISDGMNDIATISKVWFTWGDSYEINILEGVNEILAIATVLAIDCVMESDNNSSHSQ